MTEDLRIFSKQVFQIRFKENTTLMDFRGLWTKSIVEKMNFVDWRIDPTVISVFNQKSQTAFFLSYKDLGGVVIGSDLKGKITELASDYLEILFQLDRFSIKEVSRIGVRCQYLVTSNKSFKELHDSYNAILLPNWQQLEGEMEARLNDTGITLEFTGKSMSYKIQLGPMLKKQVLEFIPDARPQDIPEVALYIDIDSKKSNIAHTDKNTMKSLIRKCFDNNTFVMEKFSNLIGDSSDVEKEKQAEKA